MAATHCPFHIECHFHNSATKTQTDEQLAQFFCRMRYEDCEITQRILSGRPIPQGVCPDGNVRA
jgi:hypothetical protein